MQKYITDLNNTIFENEKINENTFKKTIRRCIAIRDELNNNTVDAVDTVDTVDTVDIVDTDVSSDLGGNTKLSLGLSLVCGKPVILGVLLYIPNIYQ